MVKVSLEDIEERRRKKLFGPTETERVRAEGAARGLMSQAKLGARLGKRPVGSRARGLRSESLNQGLIQKSPGDQHKGLDFVKAVYADRTGQEPMY